MAKTWKQKRFAATAAYTAIREIVIVQKAVMKALGLHLQRYSNPTLELKASAPQSSTHFLILSSDPPWLGSTHRSWSLPFLQGSHWIPAAPKETLRPLLEAFLCFTPSDLSVGIHNPVDTAAIPALTAGASFSINRLSGWASCWNRCRRLLWIGGIWQWYFYSCSSKSHH